VNILALGEGLAALVKAGVAPRIALDVINASSGRSFVSEVLLLEQTGVRLGSARAELGETADYLDPIRLNERQAGVEIRG
jgi:3-hydroxyisobutyrate dehydrogenase